MHPIYAFHLENKELTFLPEKWELEEKKKSPTLPKCIFLKKGSNAVLELEQPLPVYPTISTISLFYKNSHIHK